VSQAAASPVAAIFVFPEDTSKHGRATHRRLAEHMLRIIEPNVGVHRLKLRPEPEEDLPASMGLGWKSTSQHDQPKILALCREIAGVLARLDMPCFVLFHYDGDKPWSAQKRAEAGRGGINVENVEKFRAIIRPKVMQALLPLSSQSSRPPARTKVAQPPVPARTEADVQRLLGRLVEVVPFYCIESWLYQDFDTLRGHCAAGCGKHVELIERWRQDKPSIEEVVQPKKAMPCVADRKNLELAGVRFPAEDLYCKNTSFHATVERLRSAPGLVDALKKTAEG
jgi:hypothetical protein